METPKKSSNKFVSFLRYLFGNFHYQAPGFVTPLAAGTKKLYHNADTNLKKLKTVKPKLFLGLSIGVPVVIALVIGLVIWQSTRPQPVKIGFSISTPELTPLRENAQPRPVFINFDGSVAKLEDVQKVVTEGIKLSPETAGEWNWASDDMLQFTPAAEWMPGVEYKIELSKQLFPSHVLLRQYTGSFTALPFKLIIIANEFYIDPTNEDIKQVSATVQFTHPVDPASFEKRVTLRPFELDKDIHTFQDRDYKVTITYDEFYGKAFILSEPLPVPEDDVKMELRIDAGVSSAYKGRSTEKEAVSYVTIPGLTNFISINSITQTMVRNEDYKLEQMLLVDSKGRASVNDLAKNMEAWILPKDKPAAPGQKKIENIRWSNPAMVGPEVLQLSNRVMLEPMAAEHEYEALNSFKISAPQGKYLYVKINKGTPFYGKYSLSKDYDTIIRIQDYPKQIEIMHDGIILSSTGEKKVSLMAQGVSDVWFRIGRVQSDQINHLVTQSNGNLTDVRFASYRFNEDNIVENQYDTKALQPKAPGEPNYFSFDFSSYLKPDASSAQKYGVFFFEVREWDKAHKQPRSLGDKRLIIISDLGMLVKDGANETHELFVQSISTGQPVTGARVQVLGKNGIAVLATTTDVNGHAILPSFRSFEHEKTPVVYLVTRGDDLSFMPVDAPGRWLDYSKFDVAGVYGATDPNKIESYLFSDRGIYRPGDGFNIGMIVKAGDWGKSLAGIPLEVAIEDPRGLEIYSKKFKLAAIGFEELQYTTEETSPTGTYQINLYKIVKDRRWETLGSTTIKVEEFLPDRLSISSVIIGAKDIGWVAPDSLSGVVTLRNLFGSPAVGNRIVGRMTLAPGTMWFRPYRDFQFSDPLTEGKYYSETLPEKTTDADGKATFDFNLNRFDAATYTLTFEADGFEKEGGRNVSTLSRTLVSPLPYLIGAKANGDLSYIYRNSERSISVIAINSALEKTAVQNIQFELNEIQHVSVLTKMANGTYGYKSVEKTVPVSAFVKSIPAQGLNYPLPTDQPGDYELIIKNADGMIFSKVKFTVVGMGNITRSLDKTAELEIRLNKTDYEPGDEIEIFVKAPYTGAGLITIERDKIYSYQWFQSQSNSFIRKITLPADLEGNGYINVAFVRAADSKDIYMSPLSYGVAPFSVSKKNRTNTISITMPAQARSGEPFPISYKTDKPGKIVVFAVDEGILQVANYQTPDPLGHFFQKRALEVRTSQLLDLILPEFSLLQSRAAMGGGMGFDEIAKNLNPFKRKRHKPVAYWSGILDSDQSERKLSYTVPDYFNGTLRVMAVVVSQDAIGTFEERAIVKNPYIISPNVPMFAAPGDSFQVTVTVTNSVDGSGNKSPLQLEVLSTPQLKVSDPLRKLFIDEDGDTTLTFFVKANNLPGGAALNFEVTGPNESTRLEAYLSVRPAVPYQTRVTTGVVKDGDVEVETPRQMYDDFRVLNASVSFLPVGLSKGLVTYLDHYPYGCTEQVLSQAFPYLYLKDVNGFGIDDIRAAEKINYALKVLQARQNSDGKFGIWAANSHTSDFITVYGAHFITECKRAGYYVPDNLYQNTLNALKEIAGKKNKSFNDVRVQTYAIYMLTRNEIVTTNYIATVRKLLDEKYPNWKDELASGYLAGSYMLMKQTGEAEGLFNKSAKVQLKPSASWYFCDGFIQNAQMLYLLAEHYPDKLKDVSASIISQLATFMQDGYYSTITGSYAIMALSAYAKAAGEPTAGQVSVTQILKDKSKELLKLPAGNFPTVDYSDQATKLLIDNGENLNLYYQVVQGGFDTTLPEKRVSKGLEVYREFTDADGKPIGNITLGDEVTVHLKFRSLTDEALYNIAIVDLLPAGLEAVPTSVREERSGSWHPDYTDIREDRLVIFGTVERNVKEFVYTVRAINKGTFTVPPIYGESMYDRSIYGYSPQEGIVVE
ncbi:alpha-2-macroglobulin [candidate division KSB1 bacterium]|nr:alpha-2-macroglobulin [candidate division KSB1 bacterium]